MLNTSLRTLPLAGAPPPRLDLRQEAGTPLVHALVGCGAVIAGAALLVRAVPWLAAGQWGAPAVLGAVHAFTLGWLLTLVVGTLYQLGPVALRVPARHGALWRVLLPLHVAAVLLVAWGTGTARWRIAAAGWACLLLALVPTAIVQLGPWRAPPSTRARMRLVTLSFVMLALALLVAALRLVWGRAGFMPDPDGLRLAHVALGLGGFGTLIAWAVGGHVLPMFLGTRAAQTATARLVPWLLAGGALLTLPAVMPALAPLRAAAVLLLAAGQLLMCRHAFDWFGRRARVTLDPALALVAAAFVCLGAASVLQGVLAGGVLLGIVHPASPGIARAITAWGVLFLPGWLSLLIAGVLYRVFPFLCWMRRAGPDARPAAALPAAPRAAPIRVTQFARPGLAWSSVALLVAGTLLLAVTVATGAPAAARFAALGYAAGMTCLALHHVLAFGAPPRAASPSAAVSGAASVAAPSTTTPARS